MNCNWDQELQLALRLADISDEISRRYFHKSMEVNLKQDSSPVTEVDFEIEHCLRKVIESECPNDGILGEEYGQTQYSSKEHQRTWVIDPLDHTRHFARGNPEYGTLIALLVDEQPCVGVVSAPSLRQRWWAAKGGGAWANQRKIEVSSVASLDSAHFGIAGHREWLDRYDWKKIATLLNYVEYSYGTPGGFMPAMMVASGQLDAFVEPWGSIWDHSATAIIVEEAGGKASALTGTSPIGGSLLVSNGLLHDNLLSYF
jgi:histidinol-phosphatase